jgi:hypothetical protein
MGWVVVDGDSVAVGAVSPNPAPAELSRFDRMTSWGPSAGHSGEPTAAGTAHTLHKQPVLHLVTATSLEWVTSAFGAVELTTGSSKGQVTEGVPPPRTSCSISSDRPQPVYVRDWPRIVAMRPNPACRPGRRSCDVSCYGRFDLEHGTDSRSSVASCVASPVLPWRCNNDISHGCDPLAGRRSTALIHRCRPSAPRTRPHHSCRSFTHQSSWPAVDHVVVSTWIGGSISRRSAAARCARSGVLGAL